MSVEWEEYLQGLYYITGVDHNEEFNTGIAAIQSENTGAFLVTGKGTLKDFAGLDSQQAYKVKFSLVPVIVQEEEDVGETNVYSFEEYVKRKQL